MKIALVANGSLENPEKLKPLISQYERIIAVDGGLHHLDKMEIVPDLIVGDFDSIDKSLLEKYSSVSQKKYPCEKDETDLELALNLIDREVTIFGALGKRADHSLYNLHLIRSSLLNISIETEDETVFAVRGERDILVKKGQRLSFLPLGKAEGVSSSGLKWEFENNTFDAHFMSISNVATANSVKISIKKGDLICFLLKG